MPPASFNNLVTWWTGSLSTSPPSALWKRWELHPPTEYAKLSRPFGTCAPELLSRAHREQRLEKVFLCVLCVLRGENYAPGRSRTGLNHLDRMVAPLFATGSIVFSFTSRPRRDSHPRYSALQADAFAARPHGRFPALLNEGDLRESNPLFKTHNLACSPSHSDHHASLPSRTGRSRTSMPCVSDRAADR